MLDAGTMGAMASPSETRVKVDKQGRLVVPQELREGIVDAPGSVLISRTPDGLLVRPVTRAGQVAVGEDGLPVLDVGRAVTNAEVLTAIDAERAGR